MPRKIFISYRRQDAAANALGICQYLENEFGRNNVFIDVDMRAGAKFPEVLEQRLAECKVMLVLIGPDWLNSRDEHGNRRLESSDDWVRVEIAHALRRDITVIPVRVNGAELPTRAALPDDIRGLLDHQAVSVSNAGFRHEMAGLVRDIGSIPSGSRWRRLGAIAAAVSSLTVLIALVVWQSPSLLESIRALPFLQVSKAARQNQLWSSRPGEWVMYAFDNQPVAYYFQPSTVKVFGDRVAYTARWPVKPINKVSSQQRLLPSGAYQESITVVDCKKSVSVLTEMSTFNNAGEVISHFKRGDPETADFSAGEAIKPGTILSIAERIVCDDQIRIPISPQLADIRLSYLSLTADANGDVFYGPTKKIVDSTYPIEVLFVVKFHEDQKFANLFPGQNVVGLPPSYRTFAQPLQINCVARKLQIPKLEYADQQGNLAYLSVPVGGPAPLTVTEGSIFGNLLDLVCGTPVPDVRGSYEGINNVTYKTGAQGEQKIVITIEQSGSDLKVNFQTASGGQGKGDGKLAGSTVDSISLQSTAPDCPGSYKASFTFADETVSWSFQGQDCGGPTEGHGTAKRTKI
jgi:TIR domain